MASFPWAPSPQRILLFASPRILGLFLRVTVYVFLGHLTNNESNHVVRFPSIPTSRAFRVVNPKSGGKTYADLCSRDLDGSCEMPFRGVTRFWGNDRDNYEVRGGRWEGRKAEGVQVGPPFVTFQTRGHSLASAGGS